MDIKQNAREEWNQLAETIRNQDLGEYLSSRGIETHKSTVCPVCGKGKNSGCASYDRKANRFHCFTCGGTWSLLDFIAWDNNLDPKGQDYYKVLKCGALMYGLPLPEGYQNQDESERKHTSTTYTHKTYTQSMSIEDTHSGAPIEEPQEAEDKSTAGVDYTAYYAECRARLGDARASAYIEKRGLTREVCERFGLGFDPEWVHPEAIRKGKNGVKTPRLIIPSGKHWYLARDIRENVPKEFDIMPKAKVNDAPQDERGAKEVTPLFNIDALKCGEPVFVVEGEIDAMSIESLGFRAVGLGSASRVGTLAEKAESIDKEIKKHNKKNRQDKRRELLLLLALDNGDGTGAKKTTELEAMLDEREIQYREVSKSLYGSFKDANECLVEDQGNFKRALEDARDILIKEKRDKYREQALGSEISRVFTSIDEKAGAFFPTGFTGLDSLLDGGLYEGFYIIGAISSLGKTALTLQIADQVASGADYQAFNEDKGGYETVKAPPRDVLIFSLEMSRKELVGRSISRISCEKALASGKTPRDISRSYRELVSPRLRKIQDRHEGAVSLLAESIADYSNGSGNHIYIVEGIGEISVWNIRRKIAEHIELTGNKPLVIVDYLQILSPTDERGTDKQNTDKAVLELKRISRDFGLPLIAISSFNRGSYSSGATTSAFKESGSIEYTADVLIGLSLTGFEFDNDHPKAKEVQDKENELKKHIDQRTGENVRGITLTILKNRSGQTGVHTSFKYFPKYSLFEEIQGSSR